MAQHQPQVRNAADPRQVRDAGRRDRDDAGFERSCFVAVLQGELGRAAMWSLLEHLGVYESVWAPSGQQLAYNAGRQDAGHELMALLLEASEPLYQLMQSEAHERARRRQAAVDAAHTKRAGGE